MLKKLVAGLALAALALAPVAPVAAQVSLNLNQPQPTVDTTGAAINPATKEGQASQLTAQQATAANTSTVAGTVTAPGTAATTAQGIQGSSGGLPVTTSNLLPQITATAGLVATVGTSAVTLFNANPNRHFIVVQVQSSAGDCFINGIGTASATDGSSLGIPRSPTSSSNVGGLYEPSTHIGTGAVSIVCTAAGTVVYSRQG